MNSKKLQLITLLALAALLSLSPSIRAQMTNQVSAPPRRPLADRGPMQMFKQSLNLTDEQAKQLEPLFKQQQAQITALRTNTALSRQERATQMNEIRHTFNTNLQSHLTPEQAQKWNAMRAPGQLIQTPAAAWTNRFATTNRFPQWQPPTTNQPVRWPRRIPAAKPPAPSGTNSVPLIPSSLPSSTNSAPPASAQLPASAKP